MPRTPETRVWLLRHGASIFNLQQRCQGCSDEPELTPQGSEAARTSGERLASEGIQAVVTSPLRRAADTAGEVMKALSSRGSAIPIETDSRLQEIELYRWEGLHFKEIAGLFPEQFSDWRLRPDTFCMESTETEVRYPVRDLYQRARSFWNDLLAAHSGKSILLVTHGGTIRALITSALGLGPEHFHSFQQSNCGISRLRFPSPSRLVKLELLNDTAHLGERLPKLKEGRSGIRLLFIPVTEANPEAVSAFAPTLDGVVVEHVLVVGPTAREVVSQLFPSSRDSCPVVSEATADSVAGQLLQQYSANQLRQVVILGSPSVLRRILHQQLSISDPAGESLDLRPLAITSLHSPGNGVPPVFQSMNMSKLRPALVGV